MGNDDCDCRRQNRQNNKSSTSDSIAAVVGSDGRLSNGGGDGRYKISRKTVFHADGRERLPDGKNNVIYGRTRYHGDGYRGARRQCDRTSGRDGFALAAPDCATRHLSPFFLSVSVHFFIFFTAIPIIIIPLPNHTLTYVRCRRAKLPKTFGAKVVYGTVWPARYI